MTWVDAAIRAFDLEGYLAQRGALPSRYGIEVTLECPTCGKEKLVVNLQKRAWHCWVCQQFSIHHDGVRRSIAGAGGLLDLIELLEGVDRQGARDFLGQYTIFDHKSELGSLTFTDVPSQAGCINPIAYPDGWGWCDPSMPFLQTRGLADREIIQRYVLGYCRVGRLQNRLVFPVFEQGHLVYYQARAMWDEKDHIGDVPYIKALNPLRIPGSVVSSELVFNLDQARCYPEVVLTEGPTDAIRTGYDAVALFGKVLHMSQVTKLYQAGVRSVVLLFDADAHEAAHAAGASVAGIFRVRVAMLPESDPGDCQRYTQEELRWWIQTAQPVVDRRQLALTFG